MVVDRPDRVECILGQGFVVLGGGLQGVRISEEAAGVLRDVYLPVLGDVIADWTAAVAATAWEVVHAIGVAAREGHTPPTELNVEEIVAATWQVVGSRESFICLKLKQRLTDLGYIQPPPTAL